MPVEIPPRMYRIVTVSGRIISVAVTYQHGHWVGSVDGVPCGTGEDCRTAAIDACEDDHHVAEVRGPGEATTAEQVEAERSDLLSGLRSLHTNPPTMKELDLYQGGPDDMRTVWYEALERAIAKVEARRG